MNRMRRQWSGHYGEKPINSGSFWFGPTPSRKKTDLKRTRTRTTQQGKCLDVVKQICIGKTLVWRRGVICKNHQTAGEHDTDQLEVMVLE